MHFLINYIYLIFGQMRNTTNLKNFLGFYSLEIEKNEIDNIPLILAAVNMEYDLVIEDNKNDTGRLNRGLELLALECIHLKSKLGLPTIREINVNFGRFKSPKLHKYRSKKYYIENEHIYKSIPFD